jgi:hypothetical protein
MPVPSALAQASLAAKAFRVGRDALRAALRARALGIGEDAREKALAMPLDDLFDAAYVGDIRADAQNHFELMTRGGARRRDPSRRASP